MWKKIRNGLIKFLVLFITFVVSFAGISYLANKDNTKVIASMSMASLPMIYVEGSLGDMNAMYGYVSEMKGEYMRDSLTPLPSDRKLSISIDTCGESITSISYEVRSLDTTRLVENTEVTDYEAKGGTIETVLPIKNLLDKDTEYLLIVKLATNKQEKISYYTRILLPSTDLHEKEKLEFVKWFHDVTFVKESADVLKSYLENTTDKNDTFQTVTIYSSLDRVTWGDLKVRQETTPVMKILEMDGSTAAIQCDFMVSVTNEETEYYQVSEYYRVRYTESRMYLLDYERTMEVVFSPTHKNYQDDMIKLGITEEDKQIAYSSDNTKIAFEQSGMLWEYDSKKDNIVQVYGFRDSYPLDVRANYDQHDIDIINIDDYGNIQFLVYGYMNRGEHEGECGVGVYYFDAGKNCVTEKAFIQSDKPYQYMKLEVEKLAYVTPVETEKNTTQADAEEEAISYVDTENELYLLLNNSVYKINLETREMTRLVANLKDNSYVIAENMKHIAWQEEMEPYQSKTVCILNIDTGKTTYAKAGAGEYIYPMGFMDDDFIYGVAKEGDVSYDMAGAALFPMYKLYIQDESGEIVKEYERNNLYIQEISLSGNVLQLKRIKKNENGTYTQAEDDNITNNKEEVVEPITVTTETSDVMKQEVYIKLSDKTASEAPKLLTPKEVVLDGDKRIVPEVDEDTADKQYLAYGKGKLQGIYTQASDAVAKAAETKGTALDSEFHYLWKRNGRKTSTQITDIKGEVVSSGKTSLGISLSTMLKHAGVAVDGDELLSQNKSPMDILSENVKGTVVNLTGCSVDTVLYYVNAGMPVLAVTGEKQGLLIVGYDNLNVIVMNPENGRLVYKMGMNDSVKYFEGKGNYFISYIPE